MPPNHQIPIEEADLWDILDWDVTAKLSESATSAPRWDPLAFVAKRLIELKDAEAMALFHRICMNHIRGATDAVRRQKAADIADWFGADPRRLVAYLSFKWGYFKTRGRAKK